MKINTLILGSPREDPAEPVLFDLFFFRETLQSSQVSLRIWRFLEAVSEASLVWKVVGKYVGYMDEGSSRAGSVLW